MGFITRMCPSLHKVKKLELIAIIFSTFTMLDDFFKYPLVSAFNSFATKEDISIMW